jgi:hypothetical protein
LEIRRILAEKIGVVSQDTLYSPRTSLRYCLPSRLVAGFPFAVHPASKNELRKRPTMEFTVSRACEGVRDGGGGAYIAGCAIRSVDDGPPRDVRGNEEVDNNIRLT